VDTSSLRRSTYTDDAVATSIDEGNSGAHVAMRLPTERAAGNDQLASDRLLSATSSTFAAEVVYDLQCSESMIATATRLMHRRHVSRRASLYLRSSYST
jgi:hypothetical protein